MKPRLFVAAMVVGVLVLGIVVGLVAERNQPDYLANKLATTYPQEKLLPAGVWHFDIEAINKPYWEVIGGITIGSFDSEGRGVGRAVLLGQCPIEGKEFLASENGFRFKTIVPTGLPPGSSVTADVYVRTSDIKAWNQFEANLYVPCTSDMKWCKWWGVGHIDFGYDPSNNIAVSDNELGWIRVIFQNVEYYAGKLITVELKAVGKHDGHLGICAYVDNISVFTTPPPLPPSALTILNRMPGSVHAAVPTEPRLIKEGETVEAGRIVVEVFDGGPTKRHVEMVGLGTDIEYTMQPTQNRMVMQVAEAWTGFWYAEQANDFACKKGKELEAQGFTVKVDRGDFKTCEQ